LSDQFTWAILTGEYPPDIGGVSHYTHHLARALAEAGDRVHVWAPANLAAPAPRDHGIVVHPLPDRYSPRSLLKLQRELHEIEAPYRLLLQYTPSAFGLLGANYAFALWLSRQRVRPWAMFHELYMPLARSQPLKYNILAVAQRLMLAVTMQLTERAFVSIPKWAQMLDSVRDGQPVQWLPIPSSVASDFNPSEPSRIRAKVLSSDGQLLLGHFGTYGQPITDLLDEIVPALLSADARRAILFMGRGSDAYAQKVQAKHPAFAPQVHATGSLSPTELSAHMSACNLLVQPYPDGVSTRRSSLVAGMALGVPTVAPVGFLSESFWLEKKPIVVAPEPTPAVMIAVVEHALRDPTALVASGKNSQRFCRDFLTMDRTVKTLRS
jgi:glycosyltransferase involved in cell wall biosynthesis